MNYPSIIQIPKDSHWDIFKDNMKVYSEEVNNVTIYYILVNNVTIYLLDIHLEKIIYIDDIVVKIRYNTQKKEFEARLGSELICTNYTLKDTEKKFLDILEKLKDVRIAYNLELERYEITNKSNKVLLAHGAIENETTSILLSAMNRNY